MFHLLAVYAFKSHWDMENAIKCYAINITFKRERFERINDSLSRIKDGSQAKWMSASAS